MSFWGPSLAGIATLFVLSTIVAAVVVRTHRVRRTPIAQASRRVLRSAGLGPSERHVLTRLARMAGVPCPASLLVSRGLYDHAVRRAQGRLGGVDRAVLARIRRRWYGAAAPPAAARPARSAQPVRAAPEPSSEQPVSEARRRDPVAIRP